MIRFWKRRPPAAHPHQVPLQRGQQLVIVTDDGTRHRIIPVGAGDIAVLAMTGPVAADPPPIRRGRPRPSTWHETWADPPPIRRGWPAAGDPVLDEQL